jgi:hypothetical protein
MRFDEINEDKDQRKQNALWAQITAHEKAAKKSKDVKRDHHLKMADQLRSQLKTIDEGFDYTAKDLGNDYAGFPSNHSMKHKFLAKIKPEKQQLYKDKMNNTHDWDSLFALFKVAKARGDIIEQGVAEGQTPDQEIERLKLRQNAEHGKAPLRRQAATQARIRELEKQIKDKQGVAEEKVRLDPKCWTGKKIGNPKTKVKGGVRVNNCVPAESVTEETNDYFKRRKDEEDRIAGTKAPAKRTPKQTDYEKKRKQQSVTEGQEVDVSAVVGKLYDIIDNQEDVIKNADYDQQVRQATIVRDRAVKALNMIKTNPSNVNSAWNYLQTGEQGVAEDLTRRDLLKGAGAAAVAGAAGVVATKADAQEVTQWTKYATDLATRTMGRIHQDTGYDLRNWLVTNVGNWVSNYCTQTNSYNAKNVIDYCNQLGYEASGLDKENKLVSAFLTNMKNRYQDFLTAYRAGINESYQKFNTAIQSQQQQKSAMGGLSEDEFGILSDALLLYAVSKEDNHPTHAQISALISRYIKSRNNKDYVNSIYSKVNQSLAQLRPNPQLYAEEKAKLYKISNSILSSMGKIVADSEPEFKESVNQGVAEEYNAEYDDEAGMADNNLSTLRRAVEGLDDLIDTGDNLPEWCQEKIAVAKSMLVSVWDYMESADDAESEDPELNEEFDLIESSINQIADHNGVDPEMIWEDLESLSHDELYVFAVTSQLNEDWQKANKSDRTDGMSRKAVKAYRRANPGSKLQTAVTTKPSKLKKGSKASKRRKSYCSRSKGQMNMHNISCAKTPDKAICKARRRWNC